METKKLAGAAVVLMTVVGVLVVFVGLPAAQTQFHYEAQYPSGETRHVMLLLDDFDTTPTDISIRFVDDPTLMYSIVVTQYESGRHHSLQHNELEERIIVEVGQTIGGSQTSSVDITLGTGTYYIISIDGDLLNVDITYDNGAVINGQDVVVTSYHNGSLDFVFTEDVNFTSSGINIRTTYDVDVLLDINLPDGMNGLLTIPMSTSFASSSMVGWGQTSLTEISTSATTEPLLDFSHETSGTIGGFLSD